jgi:CheY-like chemotaxis protein
VYLAEQGQQAVELAQQLRPDLILMDRWMPILSGPAAVRQIRQIAALWGVPIIATSASVSEADQAVIRAAGYDDFLPKPIAWPRLLALLGQYLQLEWVYAPDQEEAEAIEASEAVAPPLEELAALYELARLGMSWPYRRARCSSSKATRVGERSRSGWRSWPASLR